MSGAPTKKYLDLYHRLRALCDIDPNSSDPCWIYKGPLRGRTKNYPRINVWVDGAQKQVAAHRLALVVDEIEGEWEHLWLLYCFYLAAGFEADHDRCNNPRCINSDHLVWRTPEEHLELTVSRRRIRGSSLKAK